MDVLRRCDSPLSASDVLKELRTTNPKIMPPTVYQALAALVPTLDSVADPEDEV